MLVNVQFDVVVVAVILSVRQAVHMMMVKWLVILILQIHNNTRGSSHSHAQTHAHVYVCMYTFTCTHIGDAMRV